MKKLPLAKEEMFNASQEFILNNSARLFIRVLQERPSIREGRSDTQISWQDVIKDSEREGGM